jgi:pyruvate dehydrogenase E1 component alpha subunit
MSIDPSLQVERFKLLYKIRSVELLLAREAEARSFRTPIHLAIGQEAIAIGVAEHLNKTDSVYGNHRSHAHFLAMGGTSYSLFAEILGKADGCSGGRGGSMHLSNPEIGFIGSMPIVAGTIPVAAGAALAHKVKKDQGIAVAYFGDGAVEEGVFHETLNLASSMKLPMLLVCENNLMSSHLHISQRQTQANMSRFAIAHGVKNFELYGNDIQEISEKVKKIIDDIRKNGEPIFIEAMTYRLYGHVGFEVDEEVGINRQSDLAIWQERDPVKNLREQLLQHYIVKEVEILELESHVRESVEADWNHAIKAAYPKEDSLLDHVYFRATK